MLETKVIRFYDAPYRGRLPDGVLCRPELTALQKLVLARLGRYEGKSKEARPKLETLGRVLGVSSDAAQRAISALVQAGLLRVERRNHQRRPSVYRFLDHPWLHADAPPPESDELYDDEAPPVPRPSKPKRTQRPKPSAPEAPKVEQAMLPGVPPPPPPAPRAKSRELLAYDVFVLMRRDTFNRLGIDIVEEPKLVSAAWITTVFKAVLEAVNDDDERLCDLMALYFAEEWPARLEVPFCFAAFAKKWREQWLPKVQVAA